MPEIQSGTIVLMFMSFIGTILITSFLLLMAYIFKKKAVILYKSDEVKDAQWYAKNSIAYNFPGIFSNLYFLYGFSILIIIASLIGIYKDQSYDIVFLIILQIVTTCSCLKTLKKYADKKKEELGYIFD